jgi:hypothetical protein
VELVHQQDENDRLVQGAEAILFKKRTVQFVVDVLESDGFEAVAKCN